MAYIPLFVINVIQNFKIMSNKSKVSFGCSGIFGITFIVLLIFKLGGFTEINLSWFIVFLPLFIPLVSVVLALLTLLAIDIISDFNIKKW